MGWSVMVPVDEACDGDDGRAAAGKDEDSACACAADEDEDDDCGGGGGGEGDDGSASSSGLAIWRRPRVPTSMAMVPSALNERKQPARCKERASGRSGQCGAVLMARAAAGRAGCGRLEDDDSSGTR